MNTPSISALAVDPTWVAGCLLVIAMLVIFALGYPQLLYQISVPADIRRILRHRPHGMVPRRWKYADALLLLAMLALLIVGPASAAGRLSVPYWILPAGMGVVLVVAAGVFVLDLHQMQHHTVIDWLAASAVDRVRQSGEVDEECLTMLRLLADQSQHGDEKRLVLTSLEKVAFVAIGSTAYTGSQLDDTLKTICQVATGGDKPPSYANAALAFKILNDAITQIRAGCHTGGPDDMEAMRCVTELGKVCTKSEELSAISSTCIGLIDNDSDSLFKLARAAEFAPSRLVVLAVLSRLETLAAEAHLDPQNTVTQNYLAVAAHVSATDESGFGRRRIRDRLGEGQKEHTKQFAAAFPAAIAYHASLGHYETAGLLETLAADLGISLPRTQP